PLSPLLLFSTLPRPPLSPLFPYTTLFRSLYSATRAASHFAQPRRRASTARSRRRQAQAKSLHRRQPRSRQCLSCASPDLPFRSDRLIPSGESTLRLVRPRHRRTDRRTPKRAEKSRSADSYRQVLERPSPGSDQIFALC